jgi:predicted nucleic acid-binding protein
MSYLFDASAIFVALQPESIRKTAKNYTTELARYELGNIIWKEYSLFRRINGGRRDELIDLTSDVLRNMQVLKINGRERNVLALASSLKLSFYDAAYVYCAKAMNLRFVTEDKRLEGKIKGYVDVIKLDRID